MRQDTAWHEDELQCAYFRQTLYIYHRLRLGVCHMDMEQEYGLKSDSIEHRWLGLAPMIPRRKLLAKTIEIYHYHRMIFVTTETDIRQHTPAREGNMRSHAHA